MSNDKIEPRTLSGFMELLPAQQVKFEQIVAALHDIYRHYGFYPLDTPILESSSVLLAKAGGETEKQIYRFTKGDTDLTMRFDLTVPLAKYCAKNYNELVFPFKRYQIGKVYRGERAQKGRFREFYQADIDIIGDGKLNIINDAEIPSIIYDIFTRLGLNDFAIRINNRKVLSGFFNMLDLGGLAADIMRVVDKLEKIGADKVVAELSRLGIAEDKCTKIIDFISFSGTNEQTIAFLRGFGGANDLLDLGITELELVANYIKYFGVPEKNFVIDLTIARGLDYYTGTVYETIMNKHPEIGSVCSGGRYDNLAGFYTDRNLPGVGISIGLTRLFYILNEMDYLQDGNDAPSDVLIIPMTDDLGAAIALSSRLRRDGLASQIYFEEKKFKHKITYASRLNIPFAIFLGEDEIANNQITVKDLALGEQQTLSYEAALSLMRDSIASKAAKTIICEK